MAKRLLRLANSPVLWFAAVFIALGIGIAQAQSITISGIDVQGNQRIERATVLNYAAVEVGQSLSPGGINAVGQRLRESGLFESVSVDPRGSVLVIRVVEFPTINRIAVEGNRRIDDDVLLAAISSEPRRVFSPAQAEADAASIANSYAAEGRLAATVTPRIIRRSENRVDLVFEVIEGRVVEIERIGFVGNRVFSDRRLRRVLDTKQAGFFRALIRADTLVEDRIAFDRQLLTDFYRSRGYIDFTVLSVSSELTRRRDAVLVTFNLREGQQYRIGRISVASEIADVDPAEFQDEVRIRSGIVYSPVHVESTIDRLERLATSKGLSFVRVEPRITRDDANRELDIQLVLVRGQRIFIERIDVEGNSTTLDRVIRREFRVVEGDPLNPREIAQTAERIRALGFFAEANVTSRPGTASDRVIIDVDVVERPTGTLSFGASYSPENGVGGVVSFSESNFLGRGQRLSFSISTTEDNRLFSFAFTEPYLLGRNLRYSANVEVGQSDDAQATFDTETVSVTNALGFAVGEFSRLELSYRISQDTISGVDDGSLAMPPTTGSSAILRAEEGTRLSSVVGYNYRYDTRSRGLDPTRGILLTFGQEIAGLGGDNQYVKTTGMAQGRMDVLNEDVTLTATLEGGILTMLQNNSRVTDRFFANSRLMRGFEQNGFGPRDLVVANQDSLGGNYFAVIRLEARFPLGLPEEYGIDGGVFVDAGSIWGLDNNDGGTNGSDGLDLVDDSMHIRSAAGFSIFWTTPIGPLRFNFSSVLQSLPYDLPQNFDLTLSTSF